jgi:NACHT domain
LALDPISTLVGKGFVELITKLATDHAARLLDPSPNRIAKIKTNLTPHIESTFKRCNTIKTLLNPSSPANFLSIYATQRFHCDGNTIDHYGMVDYVRSKENNVIVTGTGGSGKSMFTRYLWISLFVHSEGRIPLYLELRNLNTVSKIDLRSYIFHSISQGAGSISEHDFKANLERGDFIIILDGFDEVSYEKREEVQAAIMSIAENFTSTKLVVTSRPDGRFTSWTSFHVIDVAPLEKKDVIQLIQRAEFDPHLKTRFAKKISDDGLFEKHQSFLSNPLLSSMMLLTFSHNPNIPEKMHLFYEQAFDALYQRHDSHKPGGFRREFKTALTEDNFKRLLSYMALVSYYDQVYKFTREEALSCIKKAAGLSLIDVDPVEFLDDLCDSVCILVPEGLEYTFSHRSFQEYFTAYCLAYVTTQNFERFIFRFARRPDDKVILLLSEMAAETFRRRFVLPAALKYSDELQLGVENKSVEKFYANCEKHFEFRKARYGRRFQYHIALSGECQLYDLAFTLEKLLWAKEPDRYDGGRGKEGIKKDDLAVRQLFNALGLKETSRIRVGAAGDRFKYEYDLENGPPTLRFNDKLAITVGTSDVLDEIFKRSYMYAFLEKKLRLANEYVAIAREIDAKSSDIMDEVFG